MLKEILDAILTAGSAVFFYALIDLFISLKPVVHKYIKSKTILNVYDLLSQQAPQFAKSAALDKYIPTQEVRSAAATKLAMLVKRNGFDVSNETIMHFTNQAVDDYKASGGKFVQASEKVAQTLLDDTFETLVAKNGGSAPVEPAPISPGSAANKTVAPAPANYENDGGGSHAN